MIRPTSSTPQYSSKYATWQSICSKRLTTAQRIRQRQPRRQYGVQQQHRKRKREGEAAETDLCPSSSQASCAAATGRPRHGAAPAPPRSPAGTQYAACILCVGLDIRLIIEQRVGPHIPAGIGISLSSWQLCSYLAGTAASFCVVLSFCSMSRAGLGACICWLLHSSYLSRIYLYTLCRTSQAGNPTADMSIHLTSRPHNLPANLLSCPERHERVVR